MRLKPLFQEDWVCNDLVTMKDIGRFECDGTYIGRFECDRTHIWQFECDAMEFDHGLDQCDVFGCYMGC